MHTVNIIFLVKALEGNLAIRESRITLGHGALLYSWNIYCESSKEKISNLVIQSIQWYDSQVNNHSWACIHTQLTTRIK
jgi:hypothetical protein